MDWPQDVYVARRDYAKFLVLTNLAFAVGQLCIGVKSLVRRDRGRPPVATIARLEQVPVGGDPGLQLPRSERPPACSSGRTSSTLVAHGQKCTHLSCAVVPRPERGELHCPCHVGSFDMMSGRPVAGPPRRPLPRIALEVRGGVVYATGVEERMV